MVQKYIVSIIILASVLCASMMIPDRILSLPEAGNSLKVAKVLTLLGEEKPRHVPWTKDFQVAASRGEALVKKGIATKPGGGKTKRQSKHFVCTSCHNLEREDPDLTKPDPEARLDYVAEKGLPFLQGTTLYGVVNREQFYNDDYYLKYGDLVTAARDDLREAIQLCAVECAQGRKLKDWELESILAYLWTIDLSLSDLDLSKEDLDKVYAALDDQGNKSEAIEIIKLNYLPSSPASFGTAYDSMIKTKELKGDPENGEKIYDLSCMYCHEEGKYSFFSLDNEKLTFKHLSKKAKGYGSHSIFQVSRYGVYSKSGKRSYMPQYPHEKMSDQQLADLRAYIDMRAKG